VTATQVDHCPLAKQISRNQVSHSNQTVQDMKMPARPLLCLGQGRVRAGKVVASLNPEPAAYSRIVTDVSEVPDVK
jgi:hypothetical protein